MSTPPKCSAVFEGDSSAQRSMMRALPLERLYRDSRCGSLMLPWTAEICLERMGRESLFEQGEPQG